MPSEQLLYRLQNARDLPTLPVVLMPLLRYLERPVDAQDMHEIVRLVLQDKALAARCLQVANSPLFGCFREVESIQQAVVALGLERIHEIAASCSFLKLLPTQWSDINPSVFWAHSLGCALVSREFATKIGFPDPGKAYAAGLLHDVGIVALMWVAPQEFRKAVQLAHNEHIPLHEAEARIFGMTHLDAGQVIGRGWHLPLEIVEVITYHNSPEKAPTNPSLASIVRVSDLLCRLNGMGHGHDEERKTDFSQEPAFALLAKQYSALQPFDLARFTFEMESMLEDVRSVVNHVYGAVQ